MNLLNNINNTFNEGLSYNDTAQLCLRLYCSVDGLPEPLKPQCTKDTLAETFAELAANGFIKGPSSSSVLYGANFHQIGEKGHWVEVIASIFKKQNTVDMVLGEALVNRLTHHSSGTR